MGRKVKLFTLDNGQKVSINDIMGQTGLKHSAVRYRLAATRDPAKIFAKKGKHTNFGYGEEREVKKAVKKTVKKATINDLNQQRLLKYIITNKPFYDPYFRLALSKISYRKAN